MTQEIIEGEAVEVPERALVVRQQPGQVLVSEPGPDNMVERATSLANALKSIVDGQRLYATIQGKRYPQVEAWMTIARMDNVVAREVADGIIRHEDGSYEAAVELIRLSDGMVIGRGSALCGTTGDKPWDSRAEPARRSMAVTRATSRAFRQQYSWIMALAGYEPTPAEEIPRDDRPIAVTADVDRGDDGSLIGTAQAGDQMTSDFIVRNTPDGPALGFRLRGPTGGILVECRGDLATQVFFFKEAIVGQRVSVWGTVHTVTVPGAGNRRGFDYQALAATRVRVPEVGDLPTIATPQPDEPPEPSGEPTGDDSDFADLWDAIPKDAA